MPFEDPIVKNDNRPEQDERQRELDIDLIRRGASYEITSVPSDLADDLIKEQRGELYPDLATFIRINKSIACPKEEVEEENLAIPDDAKGLITTDSYYNFYYVDHEGNIATFRLNRDDMKQIISLRESTHEDITHTLYGQLEGLGFKWYNQPSLLKDDMLRAVYQYRKRLADKEQETKHENFDF